MGECPEQTQAEYDACMAVVDYYYSLCMQQNPGDPQHDCEVGRVNGEAYWVMS